MNRSLSHAYLFDVRAERTFDQGVNMLAVVDLLHFHFRVDVAVVEERDVRVLDLDRERVELRTSGPMAWNTNFRDAVGMGDDETDVVEADERMAFDFRRGVLALGAHRQEMHELNVVVQQRVRIGAFVFGLHAFDQIGEVSFLVEHQHFVRADELQAKRRTAVLQTEGHLAVELVPRP